MRMRNDLPSERPSRANAESIARRREVLKNLGRAGVAGGVAASPLAAFAGGGGPWCRNVIDHNKCVHASISGMASVLMSATASQEVCSKTCSYYGNSGNWPSGCKGGTGGSTSINCNTSFKVAFGCGPSATDSQGYPQSDSRCLLNKSLVQLCTSYQAYAEAHWATALANSNKLAAPLSGAPFPYRPADVVSHYGDANMKAQAYTFYTQYCEIYST